MKNKITKLELNPLLKELLINYVHSVYEDEAITDEEHLMVEYNFLKKNKQLHLLFEAEHFVNQMKYEYDKG